MDSRLRFRVTATPPAIERVLDALGDPESRAIRDETGGIKRPVAVDALKQAWLVQGFEQSTFWDGLHTDARVAVRVEAGRAETNNDGLMAAREAAMDPRVAALLLVVPARYKGASAAPRVETTLRRILMNPRVELELEGVQLVSY